MMSAALLCVFLLSAASALTVFRHPFRPHGAKCFDETGMFYSGRELHGAYYIYRNIYVFPPGYRHRFRSQVYGEQRYAVADGEDGKVAGGAPETPRGAAAPGVPA